MSAISVTSRRTVSRMSHGFLVPIAIGIFLAAVATAFFFRLDAAEGLRASVISIWALTVAQVLPVLTAFLAMDVWSEERQTRRLDLLLSIAVRERDYVVGKTLGVWIAGLFAVLLSLGVLLFELMFLSPSTLSGVRVSAVLLALLILAVQNALWSAAAVAVSAMFNRAFVSALVSILVLSVIPRVLWQALALMAPQGRTAFGEMPLDAQVVDLLSGFISTGVIGSFLVLALLSLFIGTAAVVLTRFTGRAARGRRASTIFAVLLSVAVAVSVVVLLCRLDLTLELPVRNAVSFSPRMHHIFSESSGEMSVTAFVSRRDPSFRSLTQFLRMLKRQADASMGLDLSVRYVDPKWDFGAAERLVRQGAAERSLVFEKGRRSVVLPVSGGVDDRAVASAIQRLTMPPQRRDVYWTVGHGESSFDSYGLWGLSDIARELVRNGYRNQTLDLASNQTIPTDCALIVIAGAKEGFSRAERARLDAYLKRGGRLLVLMDSSGEGGIVEMLPAWGIRPVRQPIAGARTLSGTDVVATDFADHALSSALKGSQVVLERPLSFVNSSAAEGAQGADRLDVTPLVCVGATPLVVAVERGGTVGRDLAIRPTRLVVVGDASFVMNGQLSSRANANRDLFLNAVAYLSGTDAMGASGLDPNVLSTGLDRKTRLVFAVVSILAVPLSVAGVLLFLVIFFKDSRR